MKHDMPSNYIMITDAKSAAIKTSGNENISVTVCDADRVGGQHGTTNICSPPKTKSEVQLPMGLLIRCHTNLSEG
jgi:hypothetical protein